MCIRDRHGGIPFEDYEKVGGWMNELMDRLDQMDRPQCLCHKMCIRDRSDTAKLLTGQLLVCTALSMYIFIQGIIPMYYISMILFTLGEDVYKRQGLPSPRKAFLWGKWLR